MACPYGGHCRTLEAAAAIAVRRLGVLCASAGGVGEGCGSRETNGEVADGKVSVESGRRVTVAGHGVLGRSRTTLSGPPGRHSGEKDEPRLLQDASKYGMNAGRKAK
jgi:hypothetical protein